MTRRRRLQSAGPCLSGPYGCGDRVQVCCSAVAVSCSAVADSRSAICNLLVLGPGNRTDHPKATGFLGFLVLPSASQKPHGICTSPKQPCWSPNGSPVAPNTAQGSKNLQKWSQNGSQNGANINENLNFMQNDKTLRNTINTNTFQGLCLLKITFFLIFRPSKNSSETRTFKNTNCSSFCIPKCTKSHPKAPPSCPNGPNSDPKGLPKSTQNLATSPPAANAGAQGANRWPRPPKWCPKPPKWSSQTSQMTGLGTKSKHSADPAGPANPASPASPACHQFTDH